ncbi:MAG TPA: FAD-dependent oxidoreductase, partial [Lachnospiraceae bacterium]|nr:FAD-dependent oxidoreductase [Lachnospiraceae bacterium]
MSEKSIWSESVSGKMRSSLGENIRTNTVIIGGGMAGILTAYFLVQAGVPCVVVEADRIGSGQTKNTTAKVTFQHGLIYEKLLQSEGLEKAKQYARANQEAIERYRNLAGILKNDVEW